MNENIDSIVESRCTFTTVDQNPCSRCSQQVACCCNSLLLTTLTNLLASIVIIVPITSAYLFWTDYQKARKNLKLRRGKKNTMELLINYTFFYHKRSHNNLYNTTETTHQFVNNNNKIF